MNPSFVPAGRMGEDFTMHEGVKDRLLDTLSILELNGDLARTNISSARTALKHIFPHFFPKETQPEIFSELVQHFLAKEDPALAHRQGSLKIGVEETIALVADQGRSTRLTNVKTKTLKQKLCETVW
jgi:hypothetical protein